MRGGGEEEEEERRRKKPGAEKKCIYISSEENRALINDRTGHAALHPSHVSWKFVRDGKKSFKFSFCLSLSRVVLLITPGKYILSLFESVFDRLSLWSREQSGGVREKENE